MHHSHDEIKFLSPISNTSKCSTYKIRFLFQFYYVCIKTLYIIIYYQEFNKIMWKNIRLDNFISHRRHDYMVRTLKVSRFRWSKSNLDRNLLPTRPVGEAIRSRLQVQREGDLKTENFEIPFVTLMVSKSAPRTKINFIAIWLRVERIFRSPRHSTVWKLVNPFGAIVK